VTDNLGSKLIYCNGIMHNKFKKHQKEIITFLSLLLLAVFIAKDENIIFGTAEYSFITKNGRFEYTLYEAKTDPQKTQGLQNISMLPVNHGMIFFFDDNAKPVFWMKNTYISLDLIYLDKDMKVIEIKPNQKPLSEELINTEHFTNYIVELPYGTSKRIGLETSDILERS
jgi:uncharacterized protein